MAVALSQDKHFAIGFKQQNALTVPLVATDMWSLTGTQLELLASPINEDNAKDLGHGVYPTQNFPSHIESSSTWNGRLTSESGATIAAFGLGSGVTKTAPVSGAFKYVMVAPDLTVGGLDMPVTTAVLTIGGVSDKMLVALACEEWGIQFNSGPGRDNAQFTSSWVGTGAFVKPSGITIPTSYTEHSLNAGGLTALTLVGFDYLSNLRFNTVQFSWKNNIRQGFFPGSGAQSGFQLQGRMRRGVPQITLRATVECGSGSSEEDALLSQTVGTGTITCIGAAITTSAHQLKITFQRLLVNASKIGDTDGIASYDVEYSVQQHATNGVITVESIVAQDNLLAVAS